MSLTRLAASSATPSMLESVDPRLKLVWVLAFSLIGMLLDSTAALGVACLLAALPMLALRIRLRAWIAVAAILAIVFWSTILSQGLFYGGTPRRALLTLVPEFEWFGWELGGLRIYEEGVRYGCVQSLRWLTMTLASLAVCLSTSPERLLAGLTKLRTPVALAFMAMTALRFLPTMLNEWLIVRQARRLRGAPRGWSRPWRWKRLALGELQLLLPLLANAMRRATFLATSVASRGFSPHEPRSYYPELRMSFVESLLLCLVTGLAATLASLKCLYWLAKGEAIGTASLDGLMAWVERWL